MEGRFVIIDVFSIVLPLRCGQVGTNVSILREGERLEMRKEVAVPALGAHLGLLCEWCFLKKIKTHGRYHVKVCNSRGEAG